MRGAALLKVFMGSFFIQGSWSFERMQALGFAAAASPGLKDISGGDSSMLAALQKRHLAFYNAHPYMASPVLGASLRIEERVKEGGLDEDAASRFKKKVMAPYGAVGDGFYWGSIRPMASCAGVAAALIWGMWGPLVFLLVYNVFHLWMRWKGLKMGYELGEDVVGYIGSLHFTQWGIRAKYLALALIGAATALAAWKAYAYASMAALLPYADIWFAAVSISILFTVVLLNGLFKRGFRVERLIYAVALPLILYGVIFY